MFIGRSAPWSSGIGVSGASVLRGGRKGSVLGAGFGEPLGELEGEAGFISLFVLSRNEGRLRLGLEKSGELIALYSVRPRNLSLGFGYWTTSILSDLFIFPNPTLIVILERNFPVYLKFRE